MKNEIYLNKNLGLTAIHIESITKKAKSKFGLDASEVESLREFFLEEIMG